MIDLKGTTLLGARIRLEPLDRSHLPALLSAAARNRTLYRWSPVPEGETDFKDYIDTAISWRDLGTAVPFAIVRAADSAIVGSTRFWNIEHWRWPDTHSRATLGTPDACEIGYTWLQEDSIGTFVNTETKFLMLKHAFEAWRVLRVCLHTDARNERSKRAIERIGAKFEGVLRSHKIAVDATPRDSYRFSIIAAEWPAVKAHFLASLLRP